MPDGNAVTGTLATYRAALAVVRFALETCAACGREGHDLPRAGLDSAEAWAAKPNDVTVRATVGVYGELFTFEPTRPEEMPGADAETRAATVALVTATRAACAASTWFGSERTEMWLIRTLTGSAAEALIACGWTYEHAWREVMERFTASCPEVEL